MSDLNEAIVTGDDPDLDVSAHIKPGCPIHERSIGTIWTTCYKQFRIRPSCSHGKTPGGVARSDNVIHVHGVKLEP